MTGEEIQDIKKVLPRSGEYIHILPAESFECTGSASRFLKGVIVSSH
jgi:hypothetical protein